MRADTSLPVDKDNPLIIAQTWGKKKKKKGIGDLTFNKRCASLPPSYCTEVAVCSRNNKVKKRKKCSCFSDFTATLRIADIKKTKTQR